MKNTKWIMFALLISCALIFMGCPDPTVTTPTVTTTDNGSETVNSGTGDTGDTGGTTVTYIGSKAPREAKAVGDIVFSDGSASAYNESFTDEQKAAAVAVIFDAENSLGVGLETASSIESRKEWCKESADAYNKTTYATSTSDGKANTAEIAGLPDYSETNYPAFYFCTSYSVTGFTSGWYLPSKYELGKLYDHRNVRLEYAFTALGKTNPFTSGYWWSSSQYTANEFLPDSAYVGDFDLWDTNAALQKDTIQRVCAVHSF